VPLPPLKPMAQSRRGVVQVMEVQMHPLALAIPRFIQLGIFSTVGPVGPVVPVVFCK
jgi:hypothetical protein